ncbi:MAG: HAD family hydrolase, partial [Phycicoccus sp.]
MTGPSSVPWQRYDAVLFDLDGVLTPTATVHMAAWAEMFTDVLAGVGAPGADTSPYTAADYFAHVDGKPRYDGVRDLLAARGIRLPEGSPDDPPDAETVCGLGNRKNEVFTTVLERDGVRPYPGSVALLDSLHDTGILLAVVSSS